MANLKHILSRVTACGRVNSQLVFTRSKATRHICAGGRWQFCLSRLKCWLGSFRHVARVEYFRVQQEGYSAMGGGLSAMQPGLRCNRRIRCTKLHADSEQVQPSTMHSVWPEQRYDCGTMSYKPYDRCFRTLAYRANRCKQCRSVSIHAESK